MTLTMVETSDNFEHTFWVYGMEDAAILIHLKNKRITKVLLSSPRIVMKALTSPIHLERKVMKLMIDQGLVKV
jgi:hypothetical protein